LLSGGVSYNGKALLERAMFDRVMNQVRELIRTNQYVMTLHAEDEMLSDDLTIYDVESAVLTGKIVERQKDRSSGEWGYLVSGNSIDGDAVTVVVKLSPMKKAVFITVFRE
jgi:hypothetical protein